MSKCRFWPWMPGRGLEFCMCGRFHSGASVGLQPLLRLGQTLSDLIQTLTECLSLPFTSVPSGFNQGWCLLLGLPGTCCLKFQFLRNPVPWEWLYPSTAYALWGQSVCLGIIYRIPTMWNCAYRGRQREMKKCIEAWMNKLIFPSSWNAWYHLWILGLFYLFIFISDWHIIMAHIYEAQCDILIYVCTM